METHSEQRRYAGLQHPLTHKALVQAWLILLPLLNERRITIDERVRMIDGLRAGRLQLWLNDTTAAITYFPNPTELHIWLAAGDMSGVRTGLPSMEQYAKDLGATHITLAGRPGWSRSFLQHAGYRIGSIELTKVL